MSPDEVLPSALDNHSRGDTMPQALQDDAITAPGCDGRSILQWFFWTIDRWPKHIVRAFSVAAAVVPDDAHRRWHDDRVKICIHG